MHFAHHCITISVCLLAIGQSPANGQILLNETHSTYLNAHHLLYHYNAHFVSPLPPNRCPLTEQLKMSQCELDAKDEWGVSDTDFVSNVF